MKAWLLPHQSGLSALRLGDTPDPTPSPGQVVLDVAFASLNPADRYLAEGQYPGQIALPHILGRDAVGTVSALGPGVTNVRLGDTRCILRGDAGVTRPGTFAERVAVPQEVLAEVPPGWSLEQAAGAPLVYLTAYQAVTQWPDLPPAGVVLISGASGGVGLAAIHLASAIGLTPVGLSRDTAKHPALRDNGAAAVYSPADPAWKQQLTARFGVRPVVLAIDNIAGPGFADLLETLAYAGRVSVVGRLAGPVPDFNTGSLFFRRLRIAGVAVGTYSPPEAQSAWSALLNLLAHSPHKPLIDQVFPFEDLPQAFAHLKAGPLGKVLLRIR